ncbi:MAG: 50S ribosomal protein L6 [Thermodesulfovibrionales bacterium]|nr:50S ribosomal protein L6 [Thermodesulfovibrionales bacterium]
MSRIGRKPIDVPKDVEIKMSGNTIMVKGPKGELSWAYPDRMKVKAAEGIVAVERTDNSKSDRALHGLTRSLINNMVVGVSQGYQRVLEIFGTGYKAQVQGGKIVFSLGYSRPVDFPLPDGINASMDQKQTVLTLTGIDKHNIGQAAADIRALRPPDVYKGKGVRYQGERVKLKVGKAGKK